MTQPKDINEFLGFDSVSSDDIMLLETLVKSPVFSCLKRALGKYKEVCQSELMTTDSVNKMFEMRGRIAGVTAVENLPMILVKRQRLKESQKAQEADIKVELVERRKRIFDPKLPPIVKKRPPRGALK